jgi:hypothetical protein
VDRVLWPFQKWANEKRKVVTSPVYANNRLIVRCVQLSAVVIYFLGFGLGLYR